MFYVRRTQAEALPADCETMVGARTFADVLDRHLHLEPPTDARPAGIATPSIWPAAGQCRDEFRRRGEFEGRGECLVRRRPRQLTAEQHAALLTLASAATEHLDPSFDQGALKRAFRRAARRLHPDAHPGAERAARRQLEAAFAAARDAYLTLLVLTRH